MSTWEKVGERLRTAKRKPMAQIAPAMERCDGCGLDVTRGTLANVVKAGAEPAGTSPNGLPWYRLEDWQALCSRCRR